MSHPYEKTGNQTPNRPGTLHKLATSPLRTPSSLLTNKLSSIDLHSLETANSRLQSELLTIQLEKQKVETDRAFLFNRDKKSQELIASLTHQLSILKEETSATINRQNVENSQLKESNRQLKVRLDDLSSEYEMKVSNMKSKYQALEKDTSFHRKQSESKDVVIEDLKTKIQGIETRKDDTSTLKAPHLQQSTLEASLSRQLIEQQHSIDTLRQKVAKQEKDVAYYESMRVSVMKIQEENRELRNKLSHENTLIQKIATLEYERTLEPSVIESTAQKKKIDELNILIAQNRTLIDQIQKENSELILNVSKLTEENQLHTKEIIKLQYSKIQMAKELELLREQLASFDAEYTNMTEESYLTHLQSQIKELYSHLDTMYETKRQKIRILQLRNNPIHQENDKRFSEKSDLEWEKRVDRLKTTFQAQITAYKYHIYNLLGFTVDVLGNGDVKVTIGSLEWIFSAQEGSVTCPEGYEQGLDEYARNDVVCFPGYFGRVQHLLFTKNSQ